MKKYIKFSFIFRLTNNQLISLHVEARSISMVSIPELYNYRFLYPYYSGVLRVVFVYGPNYRRKNDIFRNYKSVTFVACLMTSLLILAIVILYTMRIRIKFPGNDIVLCTMHCLIPFIYL